MLDAMRMRLGARALKAAVSIAVGIVGVALPVAVYAGKPDTFRLKASEIEVSAATLASFDGSGTKRFGKLDWRGGLRLSSGSTYFGGFSGLAMLDGGRSLVTVSDAGFWLTAELGYDNGRPVALKASRVGPILALNGKRLERWRDRDAEAVAVLSAGGGTTKLLVGFENNARVGRFDLGTNGLSAPSAYLDLPKAMAALRTNTGIESIAAFESGPLAGSLVSFAEQKTDEKGNRIGWIFSGKTSRTIKLAPIGNFDISDIAPMPDGGILVLERRFRWSEGINIRIRRLSPNDLQQSRPMLGETLFEAGSGTVLDNMEGIAVHRSEAGETILTLISDDNFNFFQSTVLLQFALVE